MSRFCFNRPFGSVLLSLVCLVALPSSSLAEPEDGFAAMQKVTSAMYSEAEEMQVKMELSGPGAPSGGRTFRIFTSAPAGKPRKTLVRFEAPANIEGTALLTVQRPKGGQDNWLYLPSLDQVRRIAPADRSQSFVQSDFAIEDMTVTIDNEARQYRILSAAPCGERKCIQIEDRPRTPSAAKESGYGHVVLHVDTALSVVHRVDFFDKSGGLLKVLRAEGLVEVAPGQWRFDRAKITHLQKGTGTVMTVLSRAHGKALDTGLFSPSNLDAW